MWRSVTAPCTKFTCLLSKRPYWKGEHGPLWGLTTNTKANIAATTSICWTIYWKKTGISTELWFPTGEVYTTLTNRPIMDSIWKWEHGQTDWAGEKPMPTTTTTWHCRYWKRSKTEKSKKTPWMTKCAGCFAWCSGQAWTLKSHGDHSARKNMHWQDAPLPKTASCYSRTKTDCCLSIFPK